jgi:hypothetical protein
MCFALTLRADSAGHHIVRIPLPDLCIDDDVTDALAVAFDIRNRV